MKKQKIISITASLVCIITAQASAQQSLNVCSGELRTGSAIHQYSIGEMVLVNTAQSGQLTVTQGFHQPLQKVDAGNSQAQTSGISLALSDLYKVYPNPTSEYLFVEANFSANSEIELAIFDAAGRQLLRRSERPTTGSHKFSFDFKPFASGQYFLNIVSKSEMQEAVRQTFTIQKK